MAYSEASAIMRVANQVGNILVFSHGANGRKIRDDRAQCGMPFGLACSEADDTNTKEVKVYEVGKFELEPQVSEKLRDELASFHEKAAAKAFPAPPITLSIPLMSQGPAIT